MRTMAGILCAVLVAGSAPLAAGGNPAQGPFTVNASTRIVVDDQMRFVHFDAQFKKCWTNVEWSSKLIATAPVTDLTAKGWYNVVWPGAHPSNEGMLPVWSAVRFLSDGIYRMTGQRLTSVGGHDYPAQNAIVLTTLDALQKGANVPGPLLANARKALAVKPGAPLFSADEAFCIHTENNAIYIVANQMQGLPHGVVELLLGDNAVSPQYQIGYEKLSLGPNWTYAPDFTQKPLVFNMEYDGRPGMYYRTVGPTRGYQNGATWATITYASIKDKFPNGLPAPDETVEVSDLDWNVGFRMDGCSSPGALPSQNLESFAPALAANMLATGSDKGFLTVTKLGPDAERPPATKETANWLWLDAESTGPNKGKIFECTTEAAKDHQLHWLDRSPGSQAPLTSWCPPYIDMSVPAVRQMLLKDMIKEAESYWTFNPGRSYSYPHSESSDGTPADGDIAQMTAYPNWYSDYRQAEGQPWGPYKLNGFYQGTPVQPTEGWWSTMTPVDLANMQADTVYALNNWLLREFDKYVKALPAEQQLSGGISKSELIHTLCYSYGTHDVPPNFNLDTRVRMCVSVFPMHRGQGKWKNCKTLTDIMHAMHVMLPDCDFGQYWVSTISFPHGDWGLRSVGAGGFETPEKVYSKVYDNFYAVGGRNLGVEADVDFGKNALTFYMDAKLFWEPTMPLKQLKEYRDRWLKRAYGAAAFDSMSQYYDFMAKDFTSTPSNWGRAIQYIQQADAVIPDGTQEKQRLNELKQFWYYYRLQTQFMKWDGSYKDYNDPIAPAVLDKVKELLWKGQTSYIVPLYCINWGLFRYGPMGDKVSIPSMFDICAPTYYDKSKGYIAPAHFTAEETAAWWADVVKSYPATPVR